jgi:uncharacterized protein (TIGR04255 family)
MASRLSWADPDRRALARSPLVNVVWQLRYAPVAQLGEGSAALAIRDSLSAVLSEDLTLSAALQQVTLQVMTGAQGVETQQIAAPFAATQGQTWRMSSADRSTHVTVGAGSIAVETAKYGTWNAHFEPWIRAALQAITDAAPPTIALRVGMRYINVIFGNAVNSPPFGRPEDLKGVAAPTLLGFVNDDDFDGLVDVLNGRHLLKFPDGVQCILQNALVAAQEADQGYGLLLDIDSYLDQAAAFDSPSLLELSERLHRTGLQVFQRCITPDAWQNLQPSDGGAN